MLKKIVLFSFIISFLFILLPDSLKSSARNNLRPEKYIATDNFQNLYTEINEPELNFEGFINALTGFDSLVRSHNELNNQILTFIDYSKPSTQKRLFVIDIQHKKILYKSYVAHGRNSGLNFAERFSNVAHSYMSSLGFYVTGNTYTGKHGYSLVLNGVEKGFNDNAKKRAIVMHPASYVSESYIEKYGRLGRSFGCPSIPVENHQFLIDLIKNKTCLFAYFPDSSYLEGSGYLN